MTECLSACTKYIKRKTQKKTNRYLLNRHHSFHSQRSDKLDVNSIYIVAIAKISVFWFQNFISNFRFVFIFILFFEIFPKGKKLIFFTCRHRSFHSQCSEKLDVHSIYIVAIAKISVFWFQNFIPNFRFVFIFILFVKYFYKVKIQFFSRAQ